MSSITLFFPDAVFIPVSYFISENIDCFLKNKQKVIAILITGLGRNNKKQA